MRRAAPVVFGVLAFLLVPSMPAAAHPLGNFTVNRYDGLVISADGVRVDHVVDLAEIPTVQARSSVDANGDGRFAPNELRRWAQRRCTEEQSQLELVVAREPVPLRLAGASARTVAGQAGLATLRVECDLRGAISVPSGTAVSFSDDAGDQVGWREITVRGDLLSVSGGATSEVRARSISNRLTAYPEDLLSSPLDERSVAFTVERGGVELPGEDGRGAVLPRPTDKLGQAFTTLVGSADLGFGAAVLAIGLALLIGALHAVAPGHGKTIMAFYLVGRGESRARAARAALTVGATVTVTHTAGVLVLGLIIATTVTAAPAAAYPWLGAASGLVIAVVGLALLREAVRRRRTGQHGHAHPHGHADAHGHADLHAHGHAHGHGGPHAHPDPHGHAHAGYADDVPRLEHSHLEHPNPYADADARGDAHRGAHGDAHGGAHAATLVDARPRTAASIGVRTPQHASTRVDVCPRVPNVVDSGERGVVGSGERGGVESGKRGDGEVVSDRRGRVGLIAVGIAGGLVPSPSALVVLLGAAAVGRAWFGVALVLAFGIGMAVTLSVTGLVLVVAKEKLNRLSRPGWFPTTRLHGLVPLVSAAAVCVLGVFLLARGLMALP